MKIVFFTHPDFLGHQSMPRFAKMLVDGMKRRGHDVEVWKPEPFFYKLLVRKSFRKWLGYIDQFIIFPSQVKKKIDNSNTLYIFTDQALGPWVPLAANKSHVVHCHDFLAQYSALGQIKENSTSYTGKLYQNFIRRGYSHAKNFIAVSKKTKADLLHFLHTKPEICEVVYNGLNQAFTPINKSEARDLLSTATGVTLGKGYILHVGGNQWYKNRLGVIDIYNKWRNISSLKLPLLLIGEKASVELKQKRITSLYADDIYILDSVADENVRMAYSGASVLLFPSIAEGFGWPIAEAMASGCPVITTNEMPMTEVAGGAGFFIPIMPADEREKDLWSNEAANIVNHLVNLPAKDYELAIEIGIQNAKRFETEAALDAIEKIYLNILND